MRDTLKELSVIGILAAIAGAALFSLHTTKKAAMSFQYTSGLSFSTLPNIYAGLLLFLCLLCIGKTLYDRKKFRTASVTDAPFFDRTQTYRALSTIILLFAFVLLLGKVYFGVLCMLFLWLLFFIYGKREKLKISLIGAVGALTLHFVFVACLGLRL
ncbi:MAG: tripartite tricarboxylate transporter TctB family protein [Desulfovibrio sp.]|jgi:uncharacterized membrane protein|nr:tripartite tricarboxylate transporter TctB family protein [Desulfovibrio sp.]